MTDHIAEAGAPRAAIWRRPKLTPGLRRLKRQFIVQHVEPPAPMGRIRAPVQLRAPLTRCYWRCVRCWKRETFFYGATDTPGRVQWRMGRSHGGHSPKCHGTPILEREDRVYCSTLKCKGHQQ